VFYDGSAELAQEKEEIRPPPGLYLTTANVNNASLFISSFLSGYVLPYVMGELKKLSKEFGKQSKWNFLTNRRVGKHAEGTRCDS
jgi:hypothetical protein